MVRIVEIIALIALSGLVLGFNPSFPRLQVHLTKYTCIERRSTSITIMYGSHDPDGSPLPSPVQSNPDGSPQSEKPSTQNNHLDDRLSSLKFGYERNSTIIMRGSARNPEVICSSPKNIPLRGCNMEEASATLTKRTKPTTLRALSALPCFDNGLDGQGSCPYVRLRCSKGHEWKAVPGSEVAYRCPTCAQASKASTRSLNTKQKTGKHAVTSRKPKISIFESMTNHAEGRGGTCLLSNESASSLHWNSSIPFQCGNGHRWSATAVNILKKASWCAQCLADERLFLMQETASCFGGEFLGFVDDYYAMQRQLRYQVVRGTFGMDYDDFDSSTGMFKTPGGGSFYAPKWPSSARGKGKGKGKGKGDGDGDGDGDDNGDGDGEKERSGAEWLDNNKRSKTFSQSPAYWRCAAGHVFVQSSNNVRRRRGTARKCSWCPECTKRGSKFEWRETSKERSFAIKKQRRNQSRAV